MSDFVRTFLPVKVSWPEFPKGLDSWGLSGKGQFRSTVEVGRQWTEEYGLMSAYNPDTRKFIAYINRLYKDRIIFDIVHTDLATPVNTPITGSMSISGADQTGSTLNVTSTLDKILKAGDVIKIAGLNLVYDITEDMTSPTAASIKISPPIYVGGSPADSAAITVTGVKFRCVLFGDIKFPDRTGGKLYGGMTIRLRECP